MVFITFLRNIFIFPSKQPIPRVTYYPEIIKLVKIAQFPPYSADFAFDLPFCGLSRRDFLNFPLIPLTMATAPVRPVPSLRPHTVKAAPSPCSPCRGPIQRKQHSRPSNYSEISGLIDHVLSVSCKNQTRSRKSPAAGEGNPGNKFEKWLARTSAGKPGLKKKARGRAKSAVEPLATEIRAYCGSLTGRNPLNPYKTNQDRAIHYHLPPTTHLFAICDGHGVFGHQAADFISTHLPTTLYDSQAPSKPFQSTLKEAVLACAEALGKSVVNVQMSGTTLVLVAVQGQTLWCANVGDSRAVLGKMQSCKKWSAVALTRDHKPSLPEEAERITNRGGIIDSYHEENGEAVGPSRVWLKDQSIPGLAISRSIGDSVAASVGVIPDPETIEMKLGPEDKFVLLGSDGLFEFMSNRDLVRMVVPYWKKRDAAGAAEEVIKEARRQWEAVRTK